MLAALWPQGAGERLGTYPPRDSDMRPDDFSFERVRAPVWAVTTRRRGSIGLAMVLATVLVACAGAGAPNSSVPASAESMVDFAQRTPSHECFNPPPEVRAVILQTEGLACYGGADLTFDAYVTGVGAIDCPGGLQPSWFVCSKWVALASPDVASRAAIVLAATSRRGWETMFAAVHPDVALAHSDILDQTARITGHFDAEIDFLNVHTGNVIDAVNRLIDALPDL